MNKQMVFTFVMVGLIAAGCTKQQETTETAPSTATQAQVDAQALKVTAEAQAKVAAEQVQVAANQAQQEAKAVAEAAAIKVKGLLTQAQQMIDQGKLQEAIAMAQQVLSMDPANIDAKNIIETAKAKIAAMAQQKAGDIKADLTNKLGAFGK